jgi:hypothetical protein
MDRKFMGSELLTRAEVAAILDVDVRTVDRMSSSGWLTPHRTGGAARSSRYKRDEVSALLEFRDWKRPDIATVNRIAMQALVRSRAAERKLEQLCTLLGADGTTIPTAEDEVVRLYMRAEDVVQTPELRLSAAEVLEWGRILLSINEEYLELVRVYVTPPEPWSVFTDLARRVSENGRSADGLELQSAYAYFELARRNMRNVAYLYVRRVGGEKEAKQRFPGPNSDYKTLLISSLFPH